MMVPPVAHLLHNGGRELVGASGFEPPTPRSRTECSTRLSHAPTRREMRRKTFATVGNRRGKGGLYSIEPLLHNEWTGCRLRRCAASAKKAGHDRGSCGV